MQKRFYVFSALLGLAIAALPMVHNNKAEVAKADGNTFEVTGVSNQNIANGWGLGIAVETSPYLDGGYWQEVNVNGKIHLYDASGTEVALPHLDGVGAVEEVGQQLCLGRGVGTNYNGYSITFDADLSFTLSSGTTWTNTAAKTFVCNAENGTTGVYWELEVPSTAVAVSGVSNQNIAGGYGLGIAIEFDPVLSGGYWQGVDMGEKIHMYNASGEEVALPHADGLSAVEEVGNQLCLGRGVGTNYKGWSLEFDRGLTFTLSTGNRYKVSETIKYVCNQENGTTGVYWDVDIPATAVEISAVQNQNIAGGYGLGLAIVTDPVLDGGYWVGVDMGTGVHLYNASGEEVALPHADGLPAVEEVGNQLCLGRGVGTNYKGWSIQFDQGTVFTLSSGTRYKIKETIKYVCNAENGSTGVDWSLPPQEGDPTPVKVVGVSNQNIASGYGLGLAIEFDQNLDGAYWQSVDLGEKVHMYNASGEEVALPHSEGVPAVEEVGTQLCIGRGAGCDYKGWSLKFEAGLEFTLSSGTKYVIEKTITYICNLDNGVTGQYWDVYYPEATFEYNEGYSFGNNSGWGQFYFMFANIADSGHYVALSGDAANDVKSHVLVNGQAGKCRDVLQLGGGRYELWFVDGEGPAKAGDTITITSGMPNYNFSGTINNFAPDFSTGAFFITHVLKTQLDFVFDGTTFHKYVGAPTDFTFEGKSTLSVGEEMETTVTLLPEGTYATPVYESTDATIATINEQGKVTGIAEGTTTVKATVGEITKSLEVTVLPEKAIKGIKFVGVYNYYSVLLDSDPSEFKPVLNKIKFVYEDDTTSPEIDVSPDAVVMETLDTSVEGDVELDVAVTIDEVVYHAVINVKVYSLYDQKPSEVGIVDWFAYSTFIQFPNTSTNQANFTSNDYFPLSEYANKVHYVKKDGSPLACGFYLLGANLAMFPQFKDADGNPVTLDENNYNVYYEVGDMIVIDAMTPLYKWTGDIFDAGGQGSPIAGTGEAIIEGYVKEQITYRYDGNVWGLYIPYTDMELGATELTIKVGESVSANATRVPANATTGKFEYSSSDEKVATVSPNGVIKGVGAGTCTITVKLSENGENVKTGTIALTVTDAITGLDIKGTLKVKLGTALEDVDLSQVEAYYVWASGKQGDKADLSKATITGLDTNQVGEQTVVVSVTLDGQTIKGTMTIEVYKASKGGCGGSILATSALLSVFALCGTALIFVKKKEDK